KALTAQSRSELPGIGADASRVSSASGRFPGGAVLLAWISEGYYDEQRGAEVTFTFAALVDNGGNVITTLKPAEINHGDGAQRWRPLFLVDLDGDGTEAIVVNRSYYEADEILLLRAKGKTVEPVALVSR